jgi:hypothetical protein
MLVLVVVRSIKNRYLKKNLSFIINSLAFCFRPMEAETKQYNDKFFNNLAYIHLLGVF